MKKTIFAVLAIAGLSGCANLSTIERHSTLPNNGTAIHLDAPQRVVYSRVSGELNVVCAEPSPDALQAYAASLGASLTRPTQESVNIATALSASAGSIGLRTQSITLMRDTLYRICEAYYNGEIDEYGALQLLQRSQDLTLGVLAIEQLTGAVVARQIGISTNTNAGASSQITTTQAELDKIKKEEADKKEALRASTDARDAQKATVDTAKKVEETAKVAAAPSLQVIEDNSKILEGQKDELDKSNLKVAQAAAEVNGSQIKIDKLKDLKAKEEKAPNPDAQKIANLETQINTEQDKLDKQLKPSLQSAQNEQKQKQNALNETQSKIDGAHAIPEQAAYDKAAADLKTEQDKLNKDGTAVTAAQEAYDQAVESRKAIEQNMKAAVSNANVVAAGKAAFSDDGSRGNINAETVSVLADKTAKIVESVITKGRLTDTCASILTNYTKIPNKYNIAAGQQILDLCKEVVRANIKRYMAAPADSNGASTLNLLTKE